MELYHVLNRGVEKRELFLNNADRARFVHDLYEFNDVAPADNDRRFHKMIEIRSQSFGKRDLLVDIHGWCLMGNHYHLLLSERRAGGLSMFIRKLNVGYAMYFNQKYERSGTLFQGRTKKVLIANDAHFLHILHYIHLNPLDFLKGADEWRSRQIKSSEKALEYLDQYRWSSFLDYCGKRNFPSLITMELFGDVFKNYRNDLGSYLSGIELTSVKPLLLE